VILDTNGLSAAADGDAAIERVLRAVDEIALPVIVLGEYQFGIRQSRKRAQYQRWFGELLEDCRVLDVDKRTAEMYAGIRHELKSDGRPIPSNDLWIAALARQHSLAVISRDRHFDFVTGLKRVAW
jgi:tRNA(fMet)-specific endonuclease VapC